METYRFSTDLKLVRHYLGLSQSVMADELGINRVSLARYESGRLFPGSSALERFYTFCFGKKAELGSINQIKARILDEDKKTKILVYHGAKEEIVNPIDSFHSELPVDFGNGFYAGQNLSQAATWISDYSNSSVYCFYFDQAGLKGKELSLDKDWMIAILYYRGRLNKYASHPLVKPVIEDLESCDYLIAPIADNKMYQTLEEFGRKHITDEQCLHALCASDLGKQYIFKSKKACSKLENKERLYLCQNEKEEYLRIRMSNGELGIKKAEQAIEEYRRTGLYIDELFK